MSHEDREARIGKREEEEEAVVGGSSVGVGTIGGDDGEGWLATEVAEEEEDRHPSSSRRSHAISPPLHASFLSSGASPFFHSASPFVFWGGGRGLQRSPCAQYVPVLRASIENNSVWEAGWKKEEEEDVLDARKRRLVRVKEEDGGGGGSRWPSTKRGGTPPTPSCPSSHGPVRGLGMPSEAMVPLLPTCAASSSLAEREEDTAASQPSTHSSSSKKCRLSKMAYNT